MTKQGAKTKTSEQILQFLLKVKDLRGPRIKMIFSHHYIGLFFLIASPLARSSYIPRSSNPNHLQTFLSPVVINNLKASNASAYTCHVQPTFDQLQRQPIKTTDCNFVITSMLRQVDLTIKQSKTTVAGSAHTKTWAYGTCAIALGTTKGGTENFNMIDILRQVAHLVVSCSGQKTNFLGGTLPVSHESHSYVEVFYQQVDSSIPEDISPENDSLSEAIPSRLSKRSSPTGATPSTMMLDTPFNAKCFGNGPTIPSHFRPFFEADCNILMRRLLAEPNAMIPQEYTTVQAARHWTARTCRISFETRLDHHFFCRALYSLSDIVHVVHMIIDGCRRFGPPHLGGTRDAREGSAFRIGVWGSRLYGPALNLTREN